MATTSHRSSKRSRDFGGDGQPVSGHSEYFSGNMADSLAGMAAGARRNDDGR
tara:strand:- start:4538 stop:4693 length:156 start_codon:yes stop_codon:yes gene_type:complete